MTGNRAKLCSKREAGRPASSPTLGGRAKGQIQGLPHQAPTSSEHMTCSQGADPDRSTREVQAGEAGGD